MKDVSSKEGEMNGTLSKTLNESEIASISPKSQRVFVVAFDKLAPKLYRFCLLRVSSKELAEDLVSQTFLRAWEYLQSGQKIKSYPAFLYRVLRNLIVDHWRDKHSKIISLDEDVINALVDYGQMPEKLSRSIEFKRIIEAMGKLPEDQQEILHWRFVDGLSAKEISKISGKKTSAIYVCIYRSTQKLKKLFNNYV